MKNMKFSFAIFAVVVVLIGCILVAGCTGSKVVQNQSAQPTQTTQPTQSASAASISLTDADNGVTKTLSPLDQVEIKLNENPTTGYSWDMNTGGLTLISDNYVQNQKDEMMVGVGGVHTWILKVPQNAGTYKVGGVYKHAWENATADDTTWSATIIVK